MMTQLSSNLRIRSNGGANGRSNLRKRQYLARLARVRSKGRLRTGSDDVANGRTVLQRLDRMSTSRAAAGADLGGDREQSTWVADLRGHAAHARLRDPHRVQRDLSARRRQSNQSA